MTDTFDRVYQLVDKQLSLDSDYPTIANKLKMVLREEKLEEKGFFDALYTQTGEKADKEFALVIGFLHQEGIGTVPDKNKALEYYCKAANNNLPLAHFLAGSIYNAGSEKGLALRHIEAAAKLGVGCGQCRLGTWYSGKEEGKPADPTKAYYWYSKSSQNNDVSAQNSVAICYQDGLGIQKDTHMAIRHFMKAHKNESPCAFTNLRQLMEGYEIA